MQMNLELIKNQFEKSMDKYDNNAVVQKLMAEKLVNKISEFGLTFDCILEIGAGTGLLTREVVEKIKYKNYIANDLSPKSKKYLDEILENYIFLEGDATKIATGEEFDLIISNAVFQWFEDIEKPALHCKNLLNDNGILAFTTFSPDNYKEIKSLTGLSLQYERLADIEKIISSQYQILHKEQFEHKLTFNNPLELLAHMKNTGVNSISQHGWTFSEVKDFCDKYKEKYKDISLTYAPIMIIARKIS